MKAPYLSLNQGEKNPDYLKDRALKGVQTKRNAGCKSIVDVYSI